LNEDGITQSSGDRNRAKSRNIYDIKCTSENRQWTMFNDVPHTLISNLLEVFSGN